MQSIPTRSVIQAFLCDTTREAVPVENSLFQSILMAAGF